MAVPPVPLLRAGLGSDGYWLGEHVHRAQEGGQEGSRRGSFHFAICPAAWWLHSEESFLKLTC